MYIVFHLLGGMRAANWQYWYKTPIEPSNSLLTFELDKQTISKWKKVCILWGCYSTTSPRARIVMKPRTNISNVHNSAIAYNTRVQPERIAETMPIELILPKFIGPYYCSCDRIDGRKDEWKHRITALSSLYAKTDSIEIECLSYEFSPRIAWLSVICQNSKIY